MTSKSWAGWALVLAASGCGDDVAMTSPGSSTSAETSGTATTSEESTLVPTTGATSSGSATMSGTTGTTGSTGETTEATSTGPGTTTTGSTGDETTSSTGDETTSSTGDETSSSTGDETSSSTGDGEVCGDGLDNDGDDEIDEGCACADDDEQACFPLPESGVGACTAGTQVCVGGAWGACEGAVGPTEELCDELDNDCDDEVDEDCMCLAGQEVACYTGPPDAQDVGICASGIQVCDDTGEFGPCEGSVLPEPAEACDDLLDNDCDGIVDGPGESVGVCAEDPVAAAVVCTPQQLAPDLGGLTKTVIMVTGADQAFMVPDGVTSIWVKLWGAGGGSWNAQQGGAGGGGGFALAQLAVTPNEVLTVIVGVRGEDGFSQTDIYGGGGHGGFFAGNGGGRSAIRRGVTELATAGGGGGAGGCNVNMPCPDGGAGGGLSGTDGTDPPLADTTFGTRGFGGTQTCGGNGGTTTCGCTLMSGAGHGGAQFLGGSTIQSAPGQGGGGGGGGWFGGGSGGGDCGGNTGGSGGGGSSRVDPAVGCVVAGAGMTAANSADPDHPPNIGDGGAPGSDGNPGLVVIYH
jgi:hypothetical protein